MKRTRYQEKQEKLNKDDKKKKKIDMNHVMENFEKIEKEMVTSFGKFGRCNSPELMPCPQRFPAETVEIMGRIVCEECANEIYGNDYVRDKDFYPSDATFRCPAYDRKESCKSEAVSYEQFFTGSCCEPASRWLTKNETGKKEKLKVVERICDETITELQGAKETSKGLITEKEKLEEQLRRDEKRIEELKVSIEQSKKNLTEKEVKLADLELEVAKFNDEHDSASKRMNLLSFEYFDVAKKSKEEKIESSFCPVCEVPYNDRFYDDIKCVLPCSFKCGYHACGSCIKDAVWDSLEQEARCPKCGEYNDEEFLIA